MYRISELASRLGLARSTLLYYEKLGLLQGQRAANGYRYYSDDDLQQLLLIQQLHAGGLSLKECQQVLEQGVDRQLLQQRLQSLEQELQQKQQARDLLAALLGDSPDGLQAFHQRLEQLAPAAHLRWLQAEGLDETDACRLRWLSRDLYDHERYMADFSRVFATLDCHGPGTAEDTLWALGQIKPAPRRILDIGCGPGNSTLLLASHTQAQITALDNFSQSLTRLEQRLQAHQPALAERITTCNASMTDIPFAAASFDLLWSECSAYIMGFEQALIQWRSLLTEQGYLVISELVWLDQPAAGAVGEFWGKEYPDMQSAATRLAQCEQHGYRVIASRFVGKPGWQAYWQPLKQRLAELAPEMPDSRALAELSHEVTILEQAAGAFDYLLLVLRKQ